MNLSAEEIANLFIQAADVNRRLPITVRPKQPHSVDLGYVPDDSSDEELERKRAISRNEVGLWEVSMELIKLCPSAKNRRALWAWANSKAGGMSLAKWSKSQRPAILPATASDRAKRALQQIYQNFCRKNDLPSLSVMDEPLSKRPEIGDKTDKVSFWRDYDPKASMRCFFDDEIAGVNVKQIRSAQRRERRATADKAA